MFTKATILLNWILLELWWLPQAPAWIRRKNRLSGHLKGTKGSTMGTWKALWQNWTIEVKLCWEHWWICKKVAGQQPATQARGEAQLQLVSNNNHPAVWAKEETQLQPVSTEKEGLPPPPDPRLHRAKQREVQWRLAMRLERRKSCPSWWDAQVSAYLPQHLEPGGGQRQPVPICPSVNACDSLSSTCDCVAIVVPCIYWNQVALVMPCCCVAFVVPWAHWN